MLDYKKKAINAFMTGKYCNASDSKYSQKHKELIERAMYGSLTWHRVRQMLIEDSSRHLQKIKLA